MGIRVACPNGHRLNVKNELAGLRGVCPACGESVAIPLVEVESTAAQASSTPAQAASAEAVRPAVSNPAVAAPPSPPVSTIATNHPAEPPAATSVLWYVRNASGQQWGPASAERFAQRMGEQPFAGDSLVWRTGWEEWRVLSEVAAELPRSETPSMPPPLPPAGATVVAAETVATPLVSPSTPVQPAAPQTDPASVASVAAHRRQMMVRRNKRLQLWFSLSLLLVVVLLAATVVVVFQSQNKPKPPTPAATTP